VEVRKRKNFMRYFSFKFLFIVTLIQATILLSNPNLPIKGLSLDEYIFNPYKDEGYLQAWNFYFKSEENTIFVSSLISNLGPGSLNNGIAISIQSKQIGSKFYIKEYRSSYLKSSKTEFKIIQSKSQFVGDKNSFSIKIEIPEIQMNLEFNNLKNGFKLSGGNYPLDSKRFIRADVVFFSEKAKATIDLNGNKFEWNGTGSMEHLLTNKEIYHYSKHFELLRSNENDGKKIYLGGYTSSKNDQLDFKTYVVLDKLGNFIKSGKVIQTEIISNEIDTSSGHSIPNKIKYFLDEKNCYITVSKNAILAKMNILQSVSMFIRVIVKMFFGNPYFFYIDVEMELECNEIHLDKKKFEGILSIYRLKSN
jgi:hypothetical protein